ncbi:AraC family transcriptional regulator [Enterovibrio norvegicus FF-33]|uniref:AraC family transcriptional regulator n=1 Tax=Enterovibrio norvegicus FF-454 TaxID=1185651 RepID=A0A1E5C747_9GAMM|nr:AraC family transcriptional regulator [Enterovibrio norvegicus]OEE61012.1 AraC family transcriptional regulator [Enterovibrio norvegicus FF-454]OEE68190.1 AraC family transcriptional regulator [Enterovibrio norvegicus FF-33]OEE74948.1 AraC family transcriptional regulator [Enterovibrio norvegicus FF-162]
MRPTIERINKAVSPSWHFVDYLCDHAITGTHCGWHYHSEIELVLYHDPHKVSPGKTVLDDYVGEATHGCAYLIGPGLPHMVTRSSTATPERASSSHVLWLDQAWLQSLVTTVPELSSVSDLLVRAHKGIKLSAACADALFPLMNGTPQLKPSAQFLRVVEILLLLSEDKMAQAVTSRPLCFYVAKETPVIDKLEKAQQFIADHYNTQISVEDICRHLHVSESSLYRMFEKHFAESFSDHLKNYRLGKACEWLVRSNTSVSVVAERVGFTNLSNFNRQFKTAKNMTPTEFRRLFR